MFLFLLLLFLYSRISSSPSSPSSLLRLYLPSSRPRSALASHSFQEPGLSLVVRPREICTARSAQPEPGLVSRCWWSPSLHDLRERILHHFAQRQCWPPPNASLFCAAILVAARPGIQRIQDKSRKYNYHVRTFVCFLPCSLSFIHTPEEPSLDADGILALTDDHTPPGDYSSLCYGVRPY